jgi:hypothetical protein
VILAHGDTQVSTPGAIEVAELRIGVSVTGVSLEVLKLEQLQGNALLRELSLHVTEVGVGPVERVGPLTRCRRVHSRPPR